MNKENPLEILAVADPDLADTVLSGLKKKENPVSSESVKMLVDETLWGMSLEISFGYAIAKGYVRLIENVDTGQLLKYRNLVREAGKVGPTLGRLMAVYLVPVLKQGDSKILKMFLSTVDIMHKKGTYTLKSPLESLALLLINGDIKSTKEYLELLYITFSRDLTYGQCQHFSHVLPKTVLSFSDSKRLWQIKELCRVIREDIRLADPFLDGMDKGLYLLSKDALNSFVFLSIRKCQQNIKLGIKFLSLESKLGVDTYKGLQVTVPLSQVRQQINRYLRARTGIAIPIRPLSMLPKSIKKESVREPGAGCDGKFIYLPDEINTFNKKEENINLYKCLARFESGLYEFNTFDFDLEKVLERCPSVFPCMKSKTTQKKISDLMRFFLLFPAKGLASDLFTIFEHGRIRVMLTSRYPGLVRKFMPVLQKEAQRIFKEDRCIEPIYPMYMQIALGSFADENMYASDGTKEYVKKVADRFEKKIYKDSNVEASADLVIHTYPEIEEALKKSPGKEELKSCYRPIKIPFNRQIRPDLLYSANKSFEQIAEAVKVKLEAKGVKVYKSEIKKRLAANNGVLSPDDIKDMIGVKEFQGIEIREIIGSSTPQIVDLSLADSAAGKAFWYKEWDCNIQDYLNDHVRVLDKSVTGYQSNFYHQVLERHHGLVKNVKYAFELLKPEGLTILRQWVEGDEFDYRALLDFVMDKKAGVMPSDRLYIKRIKEQRDVAVLLLVDLSRSTSNTVFGSSASVLDVEKEAIVLFCEALEVVGDAFAIAGFSGTGRLGVDYFKIKDFDEDMDNPVRLRINAMAPQRSTRMGGAIRHAVSQFDQVSSKVRLMIILGDGFPNDVDYKQDYAIKDTRKAISEARSKNIYIHAITVNLIGDPKLDDLYGNVHHNIISDVRELPDKLLRIYSALTH